MSLDVTLITSAVLGSGRLLPHSSTLSSSKRLQGIENNAGNAYLQ